MKTTLSISLIIFICFSLAYEAAAFCGFYVAKAGAELFNNKSQVIFVRDGNKSVITMSNDFKGDASDFAMVVPVPAVLKRNQIRIAEQQLFDKFDQYSGPRLVEYFDPNPCSPPVPSAVMLRSSEVDQVTSNNVKPKLKKDYKVTIEAEYAVGEYDILILSAEESGGLKSWLLDNGYSIPKNAEKVLQPYIKDNLKFFVVKVNTKVQKLQGFKQLRPLQIEFESEKFMLPIRLGMANSTGEQDMIVYAITKEGRVECANYRTVQVPSDKKVPLFVKDKYGQFYKDMFETSYNSVGKNSVFLEYAWNVTPSWGGVKCDPCVGNPPIYNDLVNAGVWWLKSNSQETAFFTRLHVRYTEEKFPEDLQFLTTPNTNHFQGRYILNHPATGDLSCDAGVVYQKQLKDRRKEELANLSDLTGWNTEKYSKYLSSGSGEIDERKNAAPFVKPEFPNQSPPSFPWKKLLVAVLVGGILWMYVRDLSKTFTAKVD